MAFVPEDGSIIPGANSFVSLAEANSFHADRGNTAWAGTDNVKEAALIKATDYIEQTYGHKWLGELISPHQSLSWPRENVPNVASDEIPVKLKQAVCTLALEALTTDLNPALARGGLVKREKVDVIEVEYMDGAKSETKRPAVDGLLRGLLSSSSALNGKVIRV